ncbi:unnamed protein product [Cladocopium goreaui]|uniref:Uncharacterized protein n=1 Tax=Cladocopium goreaui TaxID=2562237 RepID=A0A9P1DG82_9DINO|nr:unnamed protein product [Cladocopium goreaui]
MLWRRCVTPFAVVQKRRFAATFCPLLEQLGDIVVEQDIIRMRQSIEERKRVYKEGRKRFMRGGNFSCPKEENQWAYRRFGHERESGDGLAAAVKKREHEKREGRRMGLEDNLSKSWRQKLRMDFEIQCLHRADKEGQRWRDKSKEVQELQQMALEDERSRLQQLCSPVEFSEAVQGQRNAETVPVDISVLSRMVIPISSGEVKSSSTVREGELDCWARAPRSTRRASKAPEVHTCGNAICVKLCEAAG